ncbi:2-hydroxy-3-keto-5-methylthiopentenyl-1-phosphate phosphatase related protein [Candidatus Syntrophocurvum alkaliphilum]|uniref:2-hydroxy-3-keto-5-methylthiopentenyl-1-phosphate phosphatase related protein n=1 Tax=Candidatus Syntrophocurvum alkaliphilum TaxID=2293317 RepID=A0A6I6D5T4_9FIRM|nr:MtnX-like HAD-IB family phosphatase [Candidatus Syntrophocurvum alkaliphilum]QGT98683.1 2-hydroxy-3-keto-5-methylthiopentenyl-1-phosphate phosphatase related protein [Candidatus Syntrophocurvum alkaliphilum]
MDRKLIFFVDFDGTISSEDICYTMVKTYARDGWEELNELWEKGVLSTVGVAQKTLELMDIELNELEKFFNTLNIDPTFPPFVKWANINNFPIYILSDGYDNYIKLILNKNKLNIPYYANHLYEDNGLKIKAPYLNKECEQCGVCKTNLIKKHLHSGFTSVYIGDGYSDRCAIKNCDYVFAKKSLVDYCENNGIEYYSYKSFDDIIFKLKQLNLS